MLSEGLKIGICKTILVNVDLTCVKVVLLNFEKEENET
jgi:hypothetical protein